MIWSRAANQVVVSWGSKIPSSFDIDMSFIPAEYWDLIVADIIPTSGDQFIHFPTGTTTQWVRVHCKGATEGCSIAELQAELGGSFLFFRVVSGATGKSSCRMVKIILLWFDKERGPNFEGRSYA